MCRVLGAVVLAAAAPGAALPAAAAPAGAPGASAGPDGGDAPEEREPGVPPAGSHGPPVGAQRDATVGIAGRIWDDRDRDGRQDPGEPGISGVRVWTFNYALADPMSGAQMRAAAVASLHEWERGRMPVLEPAETDSTASGPDGRYDFGLLAPGPTVVAVVTATYEPETDALTPSTSLTRPHQGPDGTDSDFTATDAGTFGLAAVTTVDGDRRDLDAGLLGAASAALPVTGRGVADGIVLGAGLCAAGVLLLRLASLRRRPAGPPAGRRLSGGPSTGRRPPARRRPTGNR
ncbi:hypothetical protein [Pilimelia terevasa]|uniref:hypothetical protein n=1 Tax=Pilimelia terevasa TaxID=53372 RepID=UPI0016642867|nr:hypothetical protein [Pilimelia terevasa]